MGKKKKEAKLQDTWNNLVGKVANFPQRLTDAVEEGIQEAIAETSNLSCIKNGVLDFDLINKDLQRIYQNLEMKGNRVLSSHVILDHQLNLMEIQTYTEKDSKTYRTFNSAKIQEIRNLPYEVQDQLKKKTRVELSFTLD